MHHHGLLPVQAKEVLKSFEWSCKNGSKAALFLDHVPIPNKVVEMGEKAGEIRFTDLLVGKYSELLPDFTFYTE